MSELHIPLEVADAMLELRPELRKKLSLRDIDEMTRPFRDRIRELEAERPDSVMMLKAAKQCHTLKAENARLREALEEIRDYTSSQSPALNVPDDSWQGMRARGMANIAWKALEPKP